MGFIRLHIGLGVGEDHMTLRLYVAGGFFVAGLVGLEVHLAVGHLHVAAQVVGRLHFLLRVRANINGGLLVRELRGNRVLLSRPGTRGLPDDQHQ